MNDLESFLNRIPKKGLSQADCNTIQVKSLSPEDCLRPLLIHGALCLEEFRYKPTGDDRGWKINYLTQRKHRGQQLQMMMDFTTNKKRCRMVQIVSHFGDNHDDRSRCGICDFCLSASTKTRTFREKTATRDQSGYSLRA